MLAFADYDGNGMFKSLGNITVNPNVGLLFLRIGEKAGPPAGERAGADVLRRSAAGGFRRRAGSHPHRPYRHFPNCPRNIPHLELKEHSIYAPTANGPPVEPAWKSFDDFKDVVPPRVR